MNEIKVSVENTLEVLLDKKKYSAIKEVMNALNPIDIALILKGVTSEKIPLLFRLLPKDLAAEAFAEMESEEQELLIKSFSDKELSEVINELYVDDAADLIEEMPASVVKRILKVVPAEFRKEINEILKYPENSAGSIMTTEFVSLKPNMTITDAIDLIRKTGVDKETIYTSYVTQDKKLIGTIEVKDLLLAKNDKTKIQDIMSTNIISVTTHTDQEEVGKMFSKYDLLALPVVDSENRMIGIVTFDDAMDVMEDEVSEDIAIMGGMTPNEKTYLKSSPLELFKNRIPWLIFLMVSATFTGMIISAFEGALAAQVVLTAFIPMLMGTGGNSGSQSSVTVIRALSLNEIEFKDITKVILKEVLTSILCGVVLALACFAKLILVDRLLLGNEGVTILISLVVSLTMAVTVIVAKVVGCILPMVAKKLGLDPAVMASPFITTTVDALSLLVYFGVATLLIF